MNLYLTGMMGCGKTSIGRLLAKKRKSSFIDLDVYIEEKYKKTIPDIFDQEGEEAFRNYETEALQEVSQFDQYIIATGGGIILRDANIAIMKQTGYIIFVDRPIESIGRDIRLGHRPVVQEGINRVYQVYRDRLERYCSTCDLRFYNRHKNRYQAATVLQALLMQKLDESYPIKQSSIKSQQYRKRRHRTK